MAELKARHASEPRHEQGQRGGEGGVELIPQRMPPPVRFERSREAVRVERRFSTRADRTEGTARSRGVLGIHAALCGRPLLHRPDRRSRTSNRASISRRVMRFHLAPATVVSRWVDRISISDRSAGSRADVGGWSRAKKEALIAGDWDQVCDSARPPWETFLDFARNERRLTTALPRPRPASGRRSKRHDPHPRIPRRTPRTALCSRP